MEPRYDKYWDISIMDNYIETLGPPATWSKFHISAVKAFSLMEAMCGRVSDVVRASRISLDVSTENTNTIIDSKVGTVRATLFLHNRGPVDLQWRALLNRYEQLPWVAEARTKEPDAMLVTYRIVNGPQHRATEDTVANWIKKMFFYAGIPPGFAPHSTRHATITWKMVHGKESELKNVVSEGTRKKYYDRSGMQKISVAEATTLREARSAQMRFLYKPN